MKNNKRRIPFLAKMLQRIAPRIGAKVFIEPKWGIVSQITFKNGKKRYGRYNCLDLNSLGASEIATDKGYANFFMKRMGYPTIEGRTFYSDAWAKAIGSTDTIDKAFRYGETLGFPFITKPNSGSQGSEVTKIYNKTEFYFAMKRIFKKDKIALVEKYIEGRDYRVVVLDDRIISAYERIPLNVTGDGRSTIKNLIKKKQISFSKIKRDIKIDNKSAIIKNKLKRQGYTLASILPKSETIYLLDNANLSSGGDSIDVTSQIHNEFKKIAISLTRDMGLRLCGVDLMVQGDIKEKPNKYFIIEINAAPGLDHYVTTGLAQKKIVEDLYLKVLQSMSK
jgi:D-alanine-D-alanine ligase-like ATP-grasp enzyme